MINKSYSNPLLGLRNPRAYGTSLFYLNQDSGFESSTEHATSLKHLERVCRSFGSHKTQMISPAIACVGKESHFHCSLTCVWRYYILSKSSEFDVHSRSFVAVVFR